MANIAGCGVSQRRKRLVPARPRAQIAVGLALLRADILAKSCADAIALPAVKPRIDESCAHSSAAPYCAEKPATESPLSCSVPLTGNSICDEVNAVFLSRPSTCLNVLVLKTVHIKPEPPLDDEAPARTRPVRTKFVELYAVQFPGSHIKRHAQLPLLSAAQTVSLRL